MLRCSIAVAALGLAWPGCVSDHALGELPEPDTGNVEAASTSTADGDSQSATSAEPPTDGLPAPDEREILCETYCADGCLLGRSRAHCLYECNAEFEYADHPLAPEACEAGWEAYLGCMVSNDCITARCTAEWQTHASACRTECTFQPDGDCLRQWGCRFGEQPRTIVCTGDACTCYTDGRPDGTCVSEAACTDGPSGQAFALSCCGYDDYPDFPPSGP